eukprot:3394798-Rhodomonas_salina.1
MASLLGGSCSVSLSGTLGSPAVFSLSFPFVGKLSPEIKHYTILDSRLFATCRTPQVSAGPEPFKFTCRKIITSQFSESARTYRRPGPSPPFRCVLSHH